jgi:sugar/nucleoside kinase (ribokinase family)
MQVPDNPYGWAVRDTSPAQGVDTSHLVWAPRMEPGRRCLYVFRHTPRRGAGGYRRMYSAASRLGAGIVDRAHILRTSRLLHTSGMALGPASHSGYERKGCLEELEETLSAQPEGCLFGNDRNDKSTRWLRPVAVDTPSTAPNHAGILITTIEDMADLNGTSAGGLGAQAIIRGDLERLNADALEAFVTDPMISFGGKIDGLTIGYPDGSDADFWRSPAMGAQGHLSRSPSVEQIALWASLGGGDTWSAGFYYGLLTEIEPARLAKRALVDDPATALKQALMLDLPIITKGEAWELMRTTATGGGRRPSQ